MRLTFGKQYFEMRSRQIKSMLDTKEKTNPYVFIS
jgi:hypothetical protein